MRQEHFEISSTSPMRHDMQIPSALKRVVIFQDLNVPSLPPHQVYHNLLTSSSSPLPSFWQCLERSWLGSCVVSLLFGHTVSTKIQIIPFLPLSQSSLHHSPPTSPGPPSPGGRKETYVAACSPSRSWSPAHTAPTDNAARISSSPHCYRR